MANFPPQVADFQAYFTREFIYGSGTDMVTVPDIQRALNEAPSLFNSSLLVTAQDNLTAYLYLTAHILVMNVQGAGGLSARPRGRGVRNVGESVQVSKGLGQANVTYQVPPARIADNPLFLYFFRTDFGQRYMMMIEPATAFPAAVACGPDQVVQWMDE